MCPSHDDPSWPAHPARRMNFLPKNEVCCCGWRTTPLPQPSTCVRLARSAFRASGRTARRFHDSLLSRRSAGLRWLCVSGNAAVSHRRRKRARRGLRRLALLASNRDEVPELQISLSVLSPPQLDCAGTNRNRTPRPAGQPWSPPRPAAAASAGRARMGPHHLPRANLQKSGLPPTHGKRGPGWKRSPPKFLPIPAERGCFAKRSRHSAQDDKRGGRSLPQAILLRKNYCRSSSTPSPTCTSSSANTIMPVAVVGVVLMTTISPTARRGMSATRIEGPLVLVNMCPSIEGGYFCVSSVCRCLERKRINRVSQVRFVRAHRAQVVADLDALVGAHVHVNLRARSQQEIEILGQHNSPAGAAVARHEAVKPFRQME